MPDVQPLRPGDPESVGAYRLTGRLGQGGQGVVYLGEDAGGRRVAVKLLHAHLDDEARRRFVRELAATKRVARFCTAQVLDADLDGDCPFIVSEFVDGASLAETVAAEGVLADGALERLAIGTLTALAAIHQAGIVHRDFKPGNVLMGPDGPRVIDFGIARALDGTAVATQPSAVIGTPAYMAPEQVRGDQVGRPADVWAWAATMVFAATGVPPFGLDNITTVIGRILHADPNLGDMSGPLRDLVNDALAKDPAARPSAQDLLLRLLGGPDVPAAAAQAPPTALLELGEGRAAAEQPTAVLPPVSGARLPNGGSTAPGPYGRPPAHGRPRFRPGVAVASAVAAVVLGGGVLLAVQALQKDDPGGRSPDQLVTSLAPGDGDGSGSTPDPDRSSAPAQTTGPRPSGSTPPAQAARLQCTNTGTHTLGPDETSSGIGFDALGGPVAWTASVSGPGTLSSTGGTLEAGGHVYVALHLSEAERSVAGSSGITVTSPQGTCSRSVVWSARGGTEPTETPSPDPTGPGDPSSEPPEEPEPEPGDDS